MDTYTAARRLASIDDSQAESDALLALLDVIRSDDRFARLRVGYLADTIEELAREYANDAEDGRLNAVLGGYAPEGMHAADLDAIDPA